MIKSMTGYGRSQQLVDGMNITVEIKSVNHRYFEFSSKLSRTYGFLDEKLKTFFNGKLTRGKMECYVQIEAVEEPDTIISLNHNLVKGYMDAYKELSEKFSMDIVASGGVSTIEDVKALREMDLYGAFYTDLLRILRILDMLCNPQCEIIWRTTFECRMFIK